MLAKLEFVDMTQDNWEITEWKEEFHWQKLPNPGPWVTLQQYEIQSVNKGRKLKKIKFFHSIKSSDSFEFHGNFHAEEKLTHDHLINKQHNVMLNIHTKTTANFNTLIH